MNRYKRAQLEVKKKKDELSLRAKMTLLAIAKEMDRRNSDSIEADDEYMVKLINEELIIHVLEELKTTTKIFKHTYNEESAKSYVYSLCELADCSVEEAYEHIVSMNKALKKLPYDKLLDMKKQLGVNIIQ